MPPSRRSSSSRSSRSSGSRRRRSSGSSHSSHSISSYRHFKNKSMLSRKSNFYIHGKAHDFIYYDKPWVDEKTGTNYKKGFYDETGKYYHETEIAFKKRDGSYLAHYSCEYCGSEADITWKEGQYPKCKNCGADMNKTHTFVDEVIDITTTDKINNRAKIKRSRSFAEFFATVLVIIYCMPIIMDILPLFTEVMFNSVKETNLEIYGDVIYLDEVSENVYEICSEADLYDKKIKWDYGQDCYYDYESDCYLWYNTDVSPNLWQYWYDDIAGDNYYGWMECEGDEWYIEISDTEWKKYEGNTSKLWHIKNDFDK